MIRNIPAVPLNGDFLNKVETLLPSTPFTVTSKLIKEVADALLEDSVIVKKYVFAVAQKRK